MTEMNHSGLGSEAKKLGKSTKGDQAQKMLNSSQKNDGDDGNFANDLMQSNFKHFYTTVKPPIAGGSPEIDFAKNQKTFTPSPHKRRSTKIASLFQ